MVWNVQKSLHGAWPLLNILMIFGIKEKLIIWNLFNVFLAIATNIPVLLMTACVVTYTPESSSTWKNDSNVRSPTLVFILICLMKTL